MKKLVFAMVILLAALSPAWAQRKVEQIVARVNADIILKSDIDRELATRRDELVRQQVDPARIEREMEEYSKTVLRDLIDRALLLQVAKEAGLNADLDVLKTMEQLRTENKFATMEDLEQAIIKDYGDLDEFKNGIRTKYLTDQVVRHEVTGRIVLTNEEMRKFYEEHKQQFDKPAGVRLSEITVLVDRRIPEQAAAQKKKIEEALAEIKKGEDFAEVAQKYSETTTAVDGGDVGFITGEINEEIAKAIDKLSRNQTTEILEFQDAYQIFKLTDRHTGGILSFDLAQQYIWPEMMSEIAPPKIREFLNRLREDGFVQVKEGFEDVSEEPQATAAAAVNP